MSPKFKILPQHAQFIPDRNDCASGPRPCPKVNCRYHLHSDWNSDDELKLRKTNTETCALDIADLGEQSLDVVSYLMGLSKEAVRQIEERAIRKLKKFARLTKLEGEFIEPHGTIYPEDYEA